MAQPKRLAELPWEILNLILCAMSKQSNIYEMMWLREVCKTFKQHANHIIANRADFESHNGLMYEFRALDKPGKRWLRFPHDIRIQYLKRLRDMEPAPGAQPRCYLYLWLSEMQQLDVFKNIRRDDQPRVVDQLMAGAALGEFNPWNLAATQNVDIHRHRRKVPVDGWHDMWAQESTESMYYSLLVCRAIQDRDLVDMEKWLKECGRTPLFTVRLNLGPLKLAARSGNNDVIKMLLRFNYPPAFDAPYEGTHLLATAVQHSNREAMEVWMGHIKDETDEGVLGELTLAVRAAVMGKNTSMIDLILDNWNGDRQPLMYQGLLRAIFLQDLSTVEFILNETTLDPSFRPRGLTEGPIAKAIRKWTPEAGTPILKTLLERGYDPTTTYNENEDAPLLVAAKKGDHELISLLLHHGARDDSHRWSIVPTKGTHPTIMRYGVLHGDGKLLHLLLRKGLDPRFEVERRMYKVVVPTKRAPSLGDIWKALQWEKNYRTEGIDLEQGVDYSVRLLHQPLQAPHTDVPEMSREEAIKRWREQMQRVERRLSHGDE
ncbi:hypothetical protein BJX68DRAFT_270393 [Aspergillus pseudodeflectus]|uniref:Ankyrin repeat-containing domain protein n=1 Tax=Aspergillus pseudodeflectus TaxID=176178 RepID=A0ABR4JSP4_9EURO